MADSQTQQRDETLPLGEGARGLRGIVASVGRRAIDGSTGLDPFDIELERQLLEIGFVEGAEVEILHEGFLGRDPIAVRVDDMSVALRRREANAILIRPISGTAADSRA